MSDFYSDCCGADIDPDVGICMRCKEHASVMFDVDDSVMGFEEPEPINKFKNLQTKILIWAKQRDLLKPENANSQFLKVVEELGEFAGAIAKNKRAEMKDGLGDTLVTLIILANQLDLDLVGCLDIAYNEIKNRTGRTVDGTFIKDE